MKRRDFLGGAAAAAAIPLLAAPAIAKGKREIRLAAAWPIEFPGLGAGTQRLAKAITNASGGALSVRILSGAESIPAGQLQDACGRGVIDMYHANESYWDGKSKAFNFFAAIPFGLTASEMNAWLAKLGGQELWDELSGRYNVKPFAAGNTGMQMGGWFNWRIRFPGDMKNMRVRASGLTRDIYKALGCIPVAISSDGAALALKTNKIDAAELIGPWIDTHTGLHNAAKHYYYPGFHEPGTQISAGLNLDVWNFLSRSEREIIAMACRAECRSMLAEFNAQNSLAIEKLAAAQPDIFKEFSTPVLTAAGRAAGEAVADCAREGELAMKIYGGYMDARARLMEAGGLGPEAFAIARRRTLRETRAAAAPERYEAREPAAPRQQPQSQPKPKPRAETAPRKPAPQAVNQTAPAQKRMQPKPRKTPKNPLTATSGDGADLSRDFLE